MSSISADAILARQDRLSHERLLALVNYNPMTGFFYKKALREGCSSTKPLGHVEKNGYRRVCVDGCRYLAHRLAWFYFHGEWPVEDVDHKNLHKDDNWISNLRPASDSQNRANMPARGSKSGLKGAHWNAARGYWQSYIKVNGKSRSLGRFDDPVLAHQAYVAALSAIHGEFARTA